MRSHLRNPQLGSIPFKIALIKTCTNTDKTIFVVPFSFDFSHYQKSRPDRNNVTKIKSFKINFCATIQYFNLKSFWKKSHIFPFSNFFPSLLFAYFSDSNTVHVHTYKIIILIRQFLMGLLKDKILVALFIRHFFLSFNWKWTSSENDLQYYFQR